MTSTDHPSRPALEPHDRHEPHDRDEPHDRHGGAPTMIEVASNRPRSRRPMLDRTEASELLSTELDRTLDLLRSLDQTAWTLPTDDCPGWDVRRMYLHVLGACEGARTGENMRQMRAARRHRSREGGPLEAALSHVQISERLGLGPTELVARLADVAPETVRQRRKVPGPFRRIAISVDGPVFERWTLGYLIDVIYLRDLWMHRIDAARSTGADLVLTPGHDGRLVADVVSEWAGRHGRPFSLTLTGPAGGRFTSAGGPRADSGGAGTPTGTAAPAELTLDAIEFCRLLAGRGEPTGLLTTVVPF